MMRLHRHGERPVFYFVSRIVQRGYAEQVVADVSNPDREKFRLTHAATPLSSFTTLAGCGMENVTRRAISVECVSRKCP